MQAYLKFTSQDYSQFTKEEIEKGIKSITDDKNYYRTKLLLALTDDEVNNYTQRYSQCEIKLISLVSALDTKS
jgi:hypothetical protein